MAPKNMRAGRHFTHDGKTYILLFGAKANLYALDINLEQPVTLLREYK